MLDWDAIERGLEGFLELLRADPRASAEFDASRADFFVEAGGARLPLAERRHLEWFLLERPDARLGAVPAVAWQEAWRASNRAFGAELSAALLQSIPGAFEVTSLVPGEGFWVRDLFTQGEHPVAERHGAQALEVGDLLVGRLFPAGAGTFLLSPAVSLFRNPALLEAVRADLDGMRAARRGVLRVQQYELERIFHGPGSVPAAAPTLDEVRARARAGLVALGLDGREVRALLERVANASQGGDGRAISGILDRLAFDTEVDLGAARLLLAELWEGERLARGPSTSAGGPPVTARDAADALEAFDRGRAQGKDLEQLFRDLERDLGVEDGESDAEDEGTDGAPDFPGVVGAMVEEFLWDLEREDAGRSRAWQGLRVFGTYARDIGVFEELGPAHLLDFGARWLIDEGPALEEQEAKTLLEALGAFCRWCQETHDLALWEGFGSTLETLKESLPRHVRLRALRLAGPGRGSYRVRALAEDRVALVDADGSELNLAVSDAQARALRVDDLVRVARHKGQSVLGASYPPEIAARLESGDSR